MREEHFECSCGTFHTEEVECKKHSARIAEHREITTNVMTSNTEIVTILIGPMKRPFTVHKAVLDLHADIMRSPSLVANIVRVHDPVPKMVRAPESISQKNPVTGGVTNPDEMELDDTEVEAKSNITPNNEAPADLVAENSDNNEKKSDSEDKTNPSTDSYFKPEFSPSSGDVKMSLADSIFQDIKPFHFAQYVSWLYHGLVTKSIQDLRDDNAQWPPSAYWIHAWVVGSKLSSPGYQNYCIDELRSYKNIVQDKWPTSNEAALIYNMTLPGNPLRKLVVSSLGLNHPSEQEEARQVEWIVLMGSIPNLSMDLAWARPDNDKEETKAWKEINRNNYMVGDDFDLGARWKNQFKGRGKKVITEDANEGCLASKLQLKYLRNERAASAGSGE